MANEITGTASIRYAKGKATASLSLSFQADQTGDKYEAGVQEIGTVEEQLQKGDVGTIGWLAIRNMDADNFIQIGASAGAYSSKIMPGKGSLISWNGSAVYAKADTAAVEVEYLVIEL